MRDEFHSFVPLQNSAIVATYRAQGSRMQRVAANYVPKIHILKWQVQLLVRNVRTELPRMVLVTQGFKIAYVSFSFQNFSRCSTLTHFQLIFQLPLNTRCPEIIAPRLCGYCGGAVDSAISIFTQLHSSGFKLEFEILFESIGQMVADLWKGKAK